MPTLATTIPSILIFMITDMMITHMTRLGTRTVTKENRLRCWNIITACKALLSRREAHMKTNTMTAIRMHTAAG